MNKEPMLRDVGRRKRLTRVGMFAFAGLSILIIGVFAISERDNIFNRTISVFTRFSSVDGLKPGANILMNGIKIGTVTSITLLRDTANYVGVELALQDRYRKYILTSATVSISQQGFIGDKQIEVAVDKSSGRQIHEGDTIFALTQPGMLSIVDDARDAMKRFEHVAVSLDTTISRLNNGSGTLGRLLNDDSFYSSLNNTIVSTDILIRRATSNLASVTSSISQSTNSIEAVSTATRATLATIDRDLDKVTANIGEVTTMVRDVLAGLNDKNGTVGALLHDRSLYDSLTSLSGTLRQTLKSTSGAAREFGLTMRGLRSGTLGALFNGHNEERAELEEKARLLERKAEDLRLLQEMLEKKRLEQNK